MTLTFELDLDRVKMNQQAKYLRQTSFRSKVIVQRHRYTDTHTPDPVIYLDTWTTNVL